MVFLCLAAAASAGDLIESPTTVYVGHEDCADVRPLTGGPPFPMGRPFLDVVRPPFHGPRPAAVNALRGAMAPLMAPLAACLSGSARVSADLACLSLSDVFFEVRHGRASVYDSIVSRDQDPALLTCWSDIIQAARFPEGLRIRAGYAAFGFAAAVPTAP